MSTIPRTLVENKIAQLRRQVLVYVASNDESTLLGLYGSLRNEPPALAKEAVWRLLEDGKIGITTENYVKLL